MVDENKKQDRQQEQAQRQDRIKNAVADFYRNGLPALQARRVKRTRQSDRQESLFTKDEHGNDD